MIPSSFPESNSFLNVDEDLASQGVEPLIVCRGETTNGMPTILSCWKFTEAEWEEVEKTKRIYLVVLGDLHPPIFLSPIKPTITLVNNG